jgi:hypothetical protein
MIGSREAFRWGFAAVMLATVLLASAHAAWAIGGIVADQGSSWSPDRDGAAIAESFDSSEAAYETDVAPGPGAVANSRLLSRRPAGLSRPAPWMSRNYVAQQGAEPLPSPSDRAAMPASPRGLPVPPMYHDHGPMLHDGAIYGDACCGDGCCGTWQSCGPAPICCLLPRLDCSSLELFAGPHGFTGPANRGASGSFGFHEGINWGSSLCGCGAFQVGANWTQSNFDGSFITDENRDQLFLTAGWFRRCDMGLQGGVVMDWQHDEWDYEVDVVQLRGELSWKCCQDDFGAWVTTGVNNDFADLNIAVDAGGGNIRIDGVNAGWEVNDLYAFFWRRQFACGGEGRVFGGFTGAGQGLVGADAQVPINPCWDLRGGFIYITPDSETPEAPAFVQETWNVSLSLVWTPFKRPGCGPNYCRPLFNVADNGSFATRVVP